MSELEEAKAKFMAACSEWADLLIADSSAQVARRGARWNFGDIDEWLPRTRTTTLSDAELVDDYGDIVGLSSVPDSQLSVMRAGYQLLLDAFDCEKTLYGTE